MPKSKRNGDAQLESLVTRIVRLEGEKRGIGNDIKDVYTEAKDKGLNVKAIRIVVKHALEDDAAREERETTEAEAEMMKSQLGSLFETTPLGRAAMAPPASVEAH